MYLNLEGFLEKSLNITYALKSTGKSLKGLEEKSLILLFSYGLNTVDRDLNLYNCCACFGAAYAAANKGTSILY